jgi:hypothetical protein
MNSAWPSKVAVLLLVLALWSARTLAQEVRPDTAQAASHGCGGVHRSGDLITCYVTFGGKTDFIGVQVMFYLPHEDKPRQHGIYLNFMLSDAKKVGPRVYAVSGMPGDCVPGTYVLAGVIARTAKDWQNYSNLAEVRIAVENDSGEPAAITDAKQGRLPPDEISQSQTIPHIVVTPPHIVETIPHIIETPPPDPGVFPRISGIKSGTLTAPSTVDLASWFARLLHKPDSCGGKHKQGETVICRIQFQENPQFQTVGLGFMRDQPRATLYQSQQCRGFAVATIDPFAPLEAGLYEVKGPIPNCGSGKYKINSVTAFGYSKGDSKDLYAKNYINGTDFRSAIVLKLQDTVHSTFPAVIRVGNRVN